MRTRKSRNLRGAMDPFSKKENHFAAIPPLRFAPDCRSALVGMTNLEDLAAEALTAPNG
jgi:hypothetical protein